MHISGDGGVCVYLAMLCIGDFNFLGDWDGWKEDIGTRRRELQRHELRHGHFDRKINNFLSRCIYISGRDLCVWGIHGGLAEGKGALDAMTIIRRYRRQGHTDHTATRCLKQSSL